MPDVTHMLNAIESGDAQAAAQLLPLVYDELRQLAEAQMAREKPGQTLDATALVHEAWLRLVPNAACGFTFANRRHFFGAAAEAMRRILVEASRRKRRRKHGGDLRRQDLQLDRIAASEWKDDLVAVDAALSKFAVRYPVHAQLVELRYFTGLTGDEASDILQISPSTADRYWIFARAWLRRELRDFENADNS